eukprot:gene13642-biopygen2300
MHKEPRRLAHVPKPSHLGHSLVWRRVERQPNHHRHCCSRYGHRPDLTLLLEPYRGSEGRLQAPRTRSGHIDGHAGDRRYQFGFRIVHSTSMCNCFPDPSGDKFRRPVGETLGVPAGFRTDFRGSGHTIE